jgi:hypothetical protein
MTHICIFDLHLLLILQSFDWLAAFHLELLQAILFIVAWGSVVAKALRY